MLSPELMRLIFEWIGTDEIKTFVNLATSYDGYLDRFIYKECTFLWRHLDLSKFPGITDTQLQSLLERINARRVTQSIVLDKSEGLPPISGAGLEPIRHSRVLQSIDLRQTETRDLGPTGLNDALVAEILSTMIPHKLAKAKVQRQFYYIATNTHAYCLPWSMFFENLNIYNLKRRLRESCSHCGTSLAIPEHFAIGEHLQDGAKCSMCNQYSCRAGWIFDSPCPRVLECHHCLESFCPTCRQVGACHRCFRTSCLECEKNHLTCRFCGITSCSECKHVLQCEDCLDYVCKSCGNTKTCSRCNKTCCEGCRTIFDCDYCQESACEECRSFAICEKCNSNACIHCYNVAGIVACDSCGVGRCAGCYNLDTMFQQCPCCGLFVCRDEFMCWNGHVCKSPGELVYSARNATADDDTDSLCTCGKKHLTSAAEQQFMCAWLVK